MVAALSPTVLIPFRRTISRFMSLEDDIASLAAAPLFNLLERDALRLVAFAAEGRVLEPGDVLFRRGERSDGGYVVRGGAIALDARDDGSPAAFVAGPSALVGRTALFTTIRRAATATAREPSSVMRISPGLMSRVLEQFPAAAVAMRDILDDELATLTQGLEQVRQRLIAIDGGEGG